MGAQPGGHVKFATVGGDTGPGRARLARSTPSPRQPVTAGEAPELRVNPGDGGWGRVLKLAQFEPRMTEENCTSI